MDDASLAGHLVTEAAALASRMRADGLDVSHKTSISDVVTDADHAAEAFVVESLRRERPDDGLLGEEGTQADGTSGRRWVIDPVDGTYNFTAGSYHWCSALALLDADDQPLLGAIAHHGSGRVLVGGPAHPPTLDGVAVSPIEDRPVGGISAATYLHPGFFDQPVVRDPWMRAARLPATLRSFGSGSMEMLGVATGELGCWFQHSTPPWDWWPGAAIVTALGGRTAQVEVDGRTWFVAGPPTAVGELTDALRG